MYEYQPTLSSLSPSVREAIEKQRKEAHRALSYNRLMGRELEEWRLERVGAWCTCARCDTATIGHPRSAFCCREVEPYKSIFPAQQCMTEASQFQRQCMDSEFLKNAAKHYADGAGKIVPSDQSLQADSAPLRFAAYRNAAFLVFSKLGKGQRRELPACVLNIIRTNYPSSTGVYTYHKDA